MTVVAWESFKVCQVFYEGGAVCSFACFHPDPQPAQRGMREVGGMSPPINELARRTFTTRYGDFATMGGTWGKKVPIVINPHLPQRPV